MSFSGKLGLLLLNMSSVAAILVKKKMVRTFYKKLDNIIRFQIIKDTFMLPHKFLIF